MIILGLNSGVTINQHDPAAALFRDGELVVASEEERFVRIKGARGHLCIDSIQFVLEAAGVSMNEVDVAVHPGDTYADMPLRIRDYLLHYFGSAPEIRMVNHQLAHLAGAYHASGYDDAMCLSYDAWGDRLSGALAIGHDGDLEVIEQIPHDNSLGLFYATMTSYLGFQPSEDEYKVMGLAAYGQPGIDLSDFVAPSTTGFKVDTRALCRQKPSPTFFEPLYGEKLLCHLGPPRRRDEAITQRHRDIAYATQAAMESCAISLVTYLHEKTHQKNLCLGGGVALNCVANRKIEELPFISKLYVFPPASDRGLAIGCAYEVASRLEPKIRPIVHMYQGPGYDDERIAHDLQRIGASFRTVDNPPDAAAEMLAMGKIIGWFQGRSEIGPRALGNRSILADPRHRKMKDEINARIKYREMFRPFAPAVLEERASELFELTHPSPFMTVTYAVRPDWHERLGAVTHIDGSARVQTVDRGTNPRFHRLIECFDTLTGVPAVVNTSLNAQGEPIVESPVDAVRTFYATGLDAIFLGPHLLEKPGQA